MEKIYSHMGISEEKLRQKNSIILDDGNEVLYQIDYNKKLIVNMEFMGQENNQKSSVNSCGWKRDSRYYFKQISSDHPEFFSQENKWAIEDGTSPVCDRVFIDFFPEYKDFLGDKLIHHHIGEDGQAVALPAGLHTGYGIVHNVEKNLGITKNGHDFSNLVQCKYNISKKFDWEKDADEIMKKVINKNASNNIHNKQKDVREKSSEPKHRKKQLSRPNKIKDKVLKGGRVIGNGLWKTAKTFGPIVGTAIIAVIIEGKINKNRDDCNENSYTDQINRDDCNENSYTDQINRNDSERDEASGFNNRDHLIPSKVGRRAGTRMVNNIEYPVRESPEAIYYKREHGENDN